MIAANDNDINETARSYAVKGIINPEIKVIPAGTTLFRLASTYTKDFPDKGVDNRPAPANYPTLEAYDAADKQWMNDNSSDEVWARLIKGAWWFASSDLVRFKYASMEAGVPLSDCGRQALAVATFWNNAEFMVEAIVRPASGLKVYCGIGCKQLVTDPVDGAVHHLVADPRVQQLFIPGMHVFENARAWFRLEHRHRLRHAS